MIRKNGLFVTQKAIQNSNFDSRITHLRIIIIHESRNILNCPSSNWRIKMAKLASSNLTRFQICFVPTRDHLQIRRLRSLNDLNFVLFCLFECIWKSFFETRHSRTLRFHVVFLCTLQFRGERLASRMAKVYFLVTYIHINLLYIRISCTCILSN